MNRGRANLIRTLCLVGRYSSTFGSTEVAGVVAPGGRLAGVTGVSSVGEEALRRYLFRRVAAIAFLRGERFLRLAAGCSAQALSAGSLSTDLFSKRSGPFYT